MKYGIKNKLILILAAVLLLGVMVHASAETAAVLSLDLKGLAAGSNGRFQAVPLNQSFSVYDVHGTLIGEMTAYATEEQVAAGQTAVLELPPDTRQVTVEPREPINPDYAFDLSYTLDFTQHSSLNYPLLVYANKGSFFVISRFSDGEVAPNAAFELSGADGTVLLAFETDKNGEYAAADDLSVGEYTLRMTKASIGGMLIKETAPLSITPYTGGEIMANAEFIGQKIAEENLHLSAPEISLQAQAPSLLLGEQRVTLALDGLSNRQNSVVIADYTARVDILQLLGAQGQVVSGGVRIDAISYENAEAHPITLIIAETSMALNPGETKDVAGLSAASFGVRYEGELAPGFDAGRIIITLSAAGEQEARDIGLSVETAWRVDETAITPEAAFLTAREVFRPAKAVAEASMAVGEDGTAEILFKNSGDIAMPQAIHDFELPEGFRVKEAPENSVLLRAEKADVLSYTAARPLQPGESLIIKLILEKAEQSGNGFVYVQSGDGADLVLNPYQSPDLGTTFIKREMPVTVAAVFDHFAGGGTVAGRVYGETPIADVGVKLAGDGIQYFARTDANGEYRFFNAPDHTSGQVEVLLPGNMAVVSSDNGDIRVAVTGSVSGKVTGIDVQAASVTLRGAREVTAVTDAVGAYVLTGLLPGEYEVEVTLPTGKLPAKNTLPEKLTIAGGENKNLDIETVEAASLSGTVQTGGEVLPIRLQGEGVQMTAADAQAFAFDNLYPGAYALDIDIPEGMLAAGEQWQLADNLAQFALNVSGREQVPGLKLQKAGSVRGYIWNDLNGDAAFTAEEPGVSNIAMTLEMLRDGVYAPVAKSVTDSYGAYEFPHLLPGEYRVHAAIDGENTFVMPGGQSRFGLEGYTRDFAVDEGAEVSGVSGGVVTPAPLKAVIFVDGNANGERSIYERGLEGVLVEVLSAAEDIVAASAMSDANGEVYFANMMQGNCRVRFTLPEKYGFTKKFGNLNVNNSAIGFTDNQTAVTDVLTLTKGKANEVGAGAILLGGVSGYAWHDINGDGITQDSEAGLEGVPITLLPKKANGQTYTILTDDMGQYHFNRVREGSYDLTVNTPEGMMFTRYSVNGREKRSIFTGEGKSSAAKLIEVVSGRTVTDQNMGFVGAGSIAVMVFLDENYNGIMDEDEKGIPNVKVVVEKTGTNDEMGEMMTDADGRAFIGALRGNTYRLRATLPDDGIVYTKTVGNGIDGNHMERRPSRRDGIEDNIILGDAEPLVKYVGAVYLGSISGMVYYDDDYSGDKQSTEKGASGLEIRLKDNSGMVVDKTNTKRDGSFDFAGVNPGDYTLEMNTPKANVYVLKGDKSIVEKTTAVFGTTKPITVRMAEKIQGIDAGLIAPGTINGMVYADRNDNGARDTDEGGYQGATITLMKEGGEVVAGPIHTNDSGRYEFMNVMPGRYLLKCEVSAEERFAVGFASQCQTAVFELRTGQTIAIPDIGALRLSRFAGYAFYDTDGNGVKSSEEKAMPGMVLTLTPTRLGLERKQAVSDENGRFEIALLRPDEYTLMAVCPDGMVFSKDDDGIYIERTGKKESGQPLHVLMGEDIADQAFGVVEPATIEGLLFLDMNNDTEMDADEALLSGFEVILYDETAEMEAARTKVIADGSFIFEGVLPSRYTVYADIPEKHRAVSGNRMNMTAAEDNRIEQSGIVLHSGEHYADLMGGLVRLTDWGGIVHVDHGGMNKPLAGATVNLLGEEGNVISSLVTEADGAYLFPDLLPGVYRIRASLPQGYLLVSPIDPSDARQKSIIKAENSAVAASEIMMLVMGQDRRDLNINAVKPGSLGDKAWFDENGNGLQDTGERPVAGVIITLLRDGVTVMETTSNEYGHFMLRDVYPSSYQVRITIPDGLKATKQHTDLALLSSILPEGASAEAVLENVRIESGAVNRNFDLGFTTIESGQVPQAVKQIQKQRWQ